MDIFKKIGYELKNQKLFRDGWLLGMLVIIAGGIGFLLVWSATHIRQADIDVPVRFTSLANFDQLGRWYQLYEVPAIALIVALVNIFLALLMYRKNRILSVFLLITAMIVVVLAIAILLGFTVIKYGTSG